MKTVHVTKRFYHQQTEMIDWCRKNIGNGSWGSLALGEDRWTVDCMFGETQFKFKEDKDCLLFVLTWNESLCRI